MLVKLIEKYDDHAIIYSFLLGIPLMFFAAPGQDPIVIPFSTCLTGTFFWYAIKSVVICSQTAIRFKREGRPLFESGGLTEYDQEKCRQIGEAVARANRRNGST